MLDWFRRRKDPPASAARKSSATASRPARLERPASSRTARPVAEAAPLPEVVAEGNTQADWSVWEDSMTAWDSQLQGLAPSSRVQVREGRPSQMDEPDPYARVGRKRDF